MEQSPRVRSNLHGRPELHGFGLPSSHLTSGFRFDSALTKLTYRIEQRGWFTDLSGEILLRVPAGKLERIAVRLERGNIKVTDRTRADVVRQGRLQLDLKTDSGLCAPAAACRHLSG